MNKPRILIVEDEAIVALDIQDRLTELGYQVTGIADREGEALALVASTHPDLVLMDIQLKGERDGIVTAEVIRRQWRIPVIFLTAFSDAGTLARAKITEPFGYIIKPFEDREIHSTIEMALYKHGAEERLRLSEQRYATTLTSIGDGVIATDARGDITFMNPVAEKHTGWSHAEANGRPLAEIFIIVNEQTRQTVADPVAKVLQEGKVVALANHTLLLRRDGKEIPIADSAAPICDDFGRITGTVLVFQDVSERRQKEAQLHRIEWMLSPKNYPPVAGDGVHQQAYGDLTGLNSSRQILDAVGTDLLHEIVSEYLELLETSSAVYERNGDYAYGIFSSGWCRFMDQAARNRCATKDNRQALAEGLWHCHESCWTDASRLSIERGEAVDIACRGGLRLHAVPIFAGDEIVGSINCGYGDPPRDPAALRELAELYEVDFDELSQLAATYQTRPTFIVELAKKRLKSSARLIGDIVRRRILERRQQESEALLSSVFNSSHQLQLLVAVAPDGELRVVSANRQYLATVQKFGFKVSKEDIIGRTMESLFRDVFGLSPEISAGSLQNYQKAASSGAVVHYQEDLVTSEGHYWSEVTITPVFDDATTVTHLLWTAHDVTERVRILEILRENEERLRLALLAANQGLYDVDLQTQKVVVSPEYALMLGYEPQEFQESDAAWRERLHPDDYEQAISAFQEFVAGKNDEYRLEFRQRTTAGDWKWILSVGKIVSRDEDGKPLRILGTHTDITERKQIEVERLEMERRLLHTQKLESLGVLAGGIAHDFNNLLMVILGYADLSLLELSPVSPVRSKIEAIITSSHRAADLCRQMLAYSGKGNFVIEHMYLHEVIEEMVHMLKSSISKNVLLNLNFEKMVPPIEGDPAQIRQVVMNLVINASEAIGDKSGVITVSTGARYCGTDYLREAFQADALAEGVYVSVEVSDTGCGMDRETQARIFEPFFTTKFTGRGLGMSAVLGIMRGHKGTLKLYSEPGRGTTFRLLFPASTEAREKGLVGEAVQGDEWKGSGKVLLVDDEETILTVGRTMLEHLGFSVVTAWNGREAVSTYRSLGEEIAFVVMDLTMPHMNGEEAFREMRSINPQVKVFISSGYSEREISARFAGKNLAGFIQKPYQLEELRNMVRKLYGDL